MAVKIPEMKQKWPHKANTITIGATQEEGGTRTSTITVGGETALPFYHFEGEMPHPPVVAIEVWDIPPDDWPDPVREPFEEVSNDPGEWARKCVEEYGADLICLRLKGCDPHGANHSPEDAVQAAQRILKSVGVPLIVWGCGNDEKDNDVFPQLAEAVSGENCLLGTIKQDNYKTLTALCTAYGHKLIAESPVDINIAKQVNILALDAGFPLENIVIYPTSGALGYGIEYVYSIMERTRIGGLRGDQAMAMPILCDIGIEVWKTKEARATQEEIPEWGDASKRGSLWEATTAYVYLLAGADVLILRHPEAVQAVQTVIKKLMGGGS